MSERPRAEQQLIEDIAGFTHDPLRYVLYVFPWGVKGSALEKHKGPRQWQRDVLDEIGQRLRSGAVDLGEVIRTAVASGHGIGKSALVSWLIKWALDTREDTRGVVTANTERQLQTKTWPEVAKWHEMSLTRKWFVYTATALFSAAPGHDKTWRIDAVPWSETNTEAFAGLHNEGRRLLLIFDEASAVADKVWEVAEGALTDEATEIIWAVFGNPTRNVGRFRECYRRFRHLWKTSQIDSRTVEGTNKAYLQELVDTYGEDSDIVKVRVRGLFPSASAKQFISAEDLDRAFKTYLRPEQYDWAPKILTCDPAWEGDDELVISLRQGLQFKVLRVMAKNDNDLEVAATLANLEDEHEADAVFVDGGFGTGIISAGRSWKRGWQIVWFGGAASRAGFKNKRAEMYFDARSWLKEGGSIYEDQHLYDELQAIETVPTMDGTLQLVGKKEIKADLGFSPGRADSLVLSFAFPVQAKPKTGFTRTREQSRRTYDPFATLKRR